MPAHKVADHVADAGNAASARTAARSRAGFEYTSTAIIASSVDALFGALVDPLSVRRSEQRSERPGAQLSEQRIEQLT